MTTERWKRIETLFHEALDRPDAERDAFLRARCGGDDALFADVMSLLAADGSPHSLLDKPALDAVNLRGTDAREDGDASPDDAIGTTIGAYHLVQRLGTGGMGAVYIAERADGQFEQRVALKLIKRGMDSDAILARFRAERRILARLQHANIARLLDGGVAADGRPYFTMEYVDGLPITDYCERHRLSIENRLVLFQAVCAAVQYAHRNLVVHRDLKPGNILVTRDGVVKLLDFGIARVLDDAEEGITRSGQRVMTPAYASPEQVRGDPVTTASDIYTLGVVLYEILCSRHPHREPTSTPAEIEEAITSLQAEKPSRLAPHLRKRLEGDLDTICLTALRKEPDRRYASAAQLADDIRRHLAGQTVSARPDTVRYRFSKFVHRHRVAVGAAAVLIASVVALTLFYTVRLAHERDLARLEARKAAEVGALLAGLFSSADPNQSRGETVTAREMLDTGRQRVRSELAGQPHVLAQMLHTIGEAYKNLGLFDEARSAIGEALEIRRAVYGPQHEDVVLSMATLADVDNETGDYVASETRAREAVTIARGLDAATVPLATSLGILATSVNMQGRYYEAEGLYREAIDAWRQTEGPRSPKASTVMNNLALLLHERSRYADAEPIFKEALEIQEEEYGKRHPETATTRYNYAQLLADEGHLEDAKVMWDEVLATDRALYPSGHPNIAFTLSAYGRLLLRLGDYEVAERLQREALDIRRRYHGESHPDVAYSLNALGTAVYERGHYGEAEALHRQSLAMHRALHPDHPIAGAVMNDIGLVLYERGDYIAAERIHREALEFQREVAEDDLRNAMAVSMVRRANDLAALGRLSEAETLARGGYELVRRIHGNRGLWVVAAMIDLAAIRLQRGAIEEAESLFTAGLARMRSFESGAPARPRDTKALLGLGNCRLADGDPDAAERHFRAALNIERRYFGDNHPKVARAYTAIAQARLAQGDTAGAEKFLTNALPIFQASVLPAQINRVAAERALAECRRPRL